MASTSVSSSSLRRRILVTGATGKQGGAVIQAFKNHPPSFEYELLALTRSPSSKSAVALAQLPHVTVVTGDLNDIDAVFDRAGGVGSIWGVFSAQTLSASKTPEDSPETKQGCAVVDASLKYGVQHLVYTSVDRHGTESDRNPTPVPHFISKHMIEEHLKAKTQNSKMTYTILRPVAFMDNATPDFMGRGFAAMWATIGDAKLQLVSVKDIGIFAAQAFAAPDTDEYKNMAISLAGDELTQAEASEVFWKVLHRPMPKTYGFVGRLLLTMIPEMGIMFKWFGDVGYAADVQKCKKLNAEMLDLAGWLKQESRFKS